MAFRRGDASNAPPSPVGDGDFQQRVEIDMAALIGSAIGNMSISPYNRDVVLAARKGLYIIDLESPFDLPRFIPQGGTWDVADVQWNPHLSRSEYIVSTSGEKLLIWNLNIVAKSNIEHVLRGHYRAVTDINWHPAEPDVLVSTGIDSWVWEWDIRTPLKAVMGLCTFTAGGTQVKWNRQDGNVLASSHQNEVLIWDRRKGSLPVSRIKAHSAKIYGIDWSYQNRQQIVTCSLDKTIKSWDINQIPTDGDECKPNTIIEPGYPVWRARNMPFGSGILSVPQRGQTALDMWNHSASKDPVQRFEGHTDVVKEFVWRRRRRDDDASFQLITWSKDRTLRFWPINSDIMEKAGGKTIHAPYTPADESISYSMRPSAPATIPKLSTPAASRGILGEVRASEILWPKPRFTEEAFRPQETHGASATGPTKVYGEPGLTRRGMIGKLTQVTPASWIANVKLGGNKRDGSSGHGSGGDGSRLNSLSRPPSTKDDEPQEGEVKTDSEDEAEAMTQSLQEEITSVLNKLASYKVRLEKAEFGKRPTCTFGLHGPWGESTSVFVRVTFTFPHSYSSNVGIPNCELEPNPLITMGSRVFMARRLFSIRKNRRPCLEPCLRFLLFGHEDSHSITRTAMDDDESSSEDEAYPAIRRPRNGSHSPVRENKNLAEPRTSQGVFSPNGQLVCFFRAPPRIVKGSGPREPSKSPSLGSRRPESAPRLFRSPLLLSDAVRRLSLAARDRDMSYADAKRTDDTNSISRIMSNLYASSHLKTRKFSEQSRPSEERPGNMSLLPNRRSMVFIRDSSAYIGIDMAAAGEYVYTMTHPLDWCKKNAEIAIKHGRYDHERFFSMLHVLIADARKEGAGVSTAFGTFSPLMFKVFEKMYAEFILRKDAQLLVMMAVVLLKMAGQQRRVFKIPKRTPPLQPTNMDYFTFVRKHVGMSEPSLPPWSRISPSPSHSPAPALSSPSSSRGSWSNLFMTSNMKRLVISEKGKEDEISNNTRPATAVPIPVARAQSHSPKVRNFKKDSPLHQTAISNSWSDNKTNPTLFTSGRNTTRRPTFSQVVSNTPSSGRRIIFEANYTLDVIKQSPFELQPSLQRQLACHIVTFAEMLSAWQYPSKRIELVKSVEEELRSRLSESLRAVVLDSSPLGITRLCGKCKHENVLASEVCAVCSSRLLSDRCSVCRLPIKGLAQTCMQCLHDSHIRCWMNRKGDFCATGCGCVCRFTVGSEGEDGSVDGEVDVPWQVARGGVVKYLSMSPSAI